MQFQDEKDYIMRIIKEAISVLVSLIAGKEYVQVELQDENKYEVSGKKLNEYQLMVDRGEINEAENIMLDDIDYSSREEVTAAIFFYRYVSEKGEAFLKQHDYSQEEVLEGLQMLAEKAGYRDVVPFLHL